VGPASNGAGGNGGDPASGGSGGVSNGGGGAPAGLSVEYLCAFTNPAGQEIKAAFNVINNSDVAVSLDDLKIRYYYTIDAGAATQQFSCDYAVIGTGNVSGTFSATSGMDADHYLEVGFSGGTTLAAMGGESGEVQARFGKTDFSVCNQANDYSFDPTKTAFATWDRVTLWHQGALAWGLEP
jgi:hypothetical protein